MGSSAGLDESHDLTIESSSTIPIPRRNLAEAFDELYMEPPVELLATPASKEQTIDDISPSGVEEFPVLNADIAPIVPHFSLHPDLKRELDQELVNRVSLYGVIFDINREANSMGQNDFLSIQRVASMDDDADVFSPLVVAVNGATVAKPSTSLSHVESALIDEEAWLLQAIDCRSNVPLASTACPPTFLQAMGEREYPRHESNSNRTQLWKPSRSWWEAKSGKNPWIEPKSHNKRWRYLWPLIHYHKFLTKCIKKLKRNGVDVKMSVSPVAVFLREEVCAVSDHLASVSLFSSDEWMDVLQKFEGWTDSTQEGQLRTVVSTLKLRSLEEPGDVDSPLLRTQIDAQFLRAMAAAREGMMQNGGKAVGESAETEDTTLSSRHGLPLHPKTRVSAPPKPRTITTPRGKSNDSTYSDANAKLSSASSRTSQYPYGHHWYGNGWAPQFAVCDENTSVHSTLSGDSFPLGYPPAHYNANYHGAYHPPPFHPSPQTPENSAAEVYPPSPVYYPSYDPYNPEHALAASQGWYCHDPNMMVYPPPPSNEPVAPGTPCGSNSPVPTYDASHQSGLSPYGTPYRDFSQASVPMSPFWSHMDYQMHTTLAMSGIVTPQKAPPSTPRGLKENHCEDETEEKKENGEGEADEVEAIEAQPILVNPHYYSYGYAAADGSSYVPPSPATQFMMSPQVNAQAAAYYAYNRYYSHHSPHRSARRRSKRGTPLREDESKITNPPPVIRKVATADAETSNSDITATTAPESDCV